MIVEITDAHMHVGEFPLVDVRSDKNSLAGYLADNGIATGMIFNPDNAFGLYWANPKNPDCESELRNYLADPNFRGVKMHPLLDGYHPDEPFVRPVIEVLIEQGLPALIHSGHPSSPWRGVSRNW